MTTLRAHFDGRVFVPNEPVDLPQGVEYELRLKPIESRNEPDAGGGFELRDGFPVFRTAVDGPVITDEAVKAAESDEA